MFTKCIASSAPLQQRNIVSLQIRRNCFNIFHISFRISLIKFEMNRKISVKFIRIRGNYRFDRHTKYKYFATFRPMLEQIQIYGKSFVLLDLIINDGLKKKDA